MQIKAKLEHLHMAPRKVRLVAGLLRGKSIAKALLDLQRLPRRSAAPLYKLLLSAQANAKHNFQIEDASSLYIKKIVVDSGPMLKRFRPRAFGRAAMIRKRTSHITLVLESREPITDAKEFKKQKPVVRETTPEDKKTDTKRIKIIPTLKEKEKKIAKSKGFVRKVFSRKAI